MRVDVYNILNEVLEERYCETAGVHASHANSNKQCINNAHFSGITSTRLCKTKVRSGFGTRLTKHSFHKREEERQHKKGAMNVLQSSRCLLLLSILLSTDLSAFAGKVLVFPVEGSHWVNMNLLIEDLHSSGHEVTVVRTTSSWYVKEHSPHYKAITVSLPEAMNIEKQDFFISFLSEMIEIQKHSGSPVAFVQFYWKMLRTLYGMHWQASQLVVEMFENPVLMKQLYEERYDLALIDPGLPPGVLVAHKLKLPVVYNVKWITSGEGHSVIAPSPVSYVPAALSQLPNRNRLLEKG
ncbi:hypothetical protein QQF64_021664 [Cirrhinus molitorella]|uniref:Uncharacterized protein n=1 Tax=Cirrhinus molitorella TaxID=172907 RepID=A0ABR3L5Y5_9TELE